MENHAGFAFFVCACGGEKRAHVAGWGWELEEEEKEQGGRGSKLIYKRPRNGQWEGGSQMDRQSALSCGIL